MYGIPSWIVDRSERNQTFVQINIDFKYLDSNGTYENMEDLAIEIN